jgi:hypothetical protein
VILEGAEGPEWDELRRHLAMCPPCVEYVRQMGFTVELIRTSGSAPAPEAAPPSDGERAALLAVFRAWKQGRG